MTACTVLDISKDGNIFLSYFAGLTDEELCELASSLLPAVKTSRRDFPYVLASKARNAEQWSISKENLCFQSDKHRTVGNFEGKLIFSM
jgi:hypothetical protein